MLGHWVEIHGAGRDTQVFMHVHNLHILRYRPTVHLRKSRHTSIGYLPEDIGATDCAYAIGAVPCTAECSWEALSVPYLEQHVEMFLNGNTHRIDSCCTARHAQGVPLIVGRHDFEHFAGTKNEKIHCNDVIFVLM